MNNFIALKKDNKSRGEILRRKAEELLKGKPSITASKLSEVDMMKLIHEFEVYKVELELQNEELILAKEKAEALATKKYIKLYNFSPTGYFSLSREGEIIELNHSGAQILGKECSQLKNSRFGFFVSDDTKPIFNHFLAKVFESNKAEICELIISVNGNPPLYLHLTGITAENGEQCLVTGADITASKQAEEVLRESELRLKYHFENSPLGVVEWNASFIVTQWSKEAERIFGWKMEEVIGKKIDAINIIYEADIPIVRQIMDRLLKGKDQMVVSTNRNITKSGDIIYCTWHNSILLDQNGQMKSAMSLIQDITKRKQAETEIIQLNEQLEDRIKERTVELLQSNAILRKTEEKYRTVADFTYDWEYWLNAEGSFNYVSPSCERITGFTSEDFIQDPQLLDRIIFKADTKIWESHIKNASIYKSLKTNPEITFRIVTKSGDLRWICCVSQNIFVNDKYLGIRASNRDITEKINAENELLNITIKVEERERNHFSRELHDGLGPLLSAIKVYFQWLAETDDDEKAKIITAKGNLYIDTAIQTTHEVALGLSSLVLNNSGYVKTVLNFVESIKDTRKLNIKFTFNTDERFGYFLETTLYRITTELINNTIKYAEATTVEIDFNYQKKMNLITFTYIDNGIGFDSVNIEKTSKGLGLRNIQQRIKIIRGVMRIETSQGIGIKVYIELPITLPLNSTNPKYK